MRTIVTTATLLVVGAIALPAQSAPLSPGASNTVAPRAVEQAHYGYYYRHHRHYRYYRRPGVYFYGPRHHRYWRHHRHW
jgi:hypothetical protein